MAMPDDAGRITSVLRPLGSAEAACRRSPRSRNTSDDRAYRDQTSGNSKKFGSKSEMATALRQVDHTIESGGSYRQRAPATVRVAASRAFANCSLFGRG